MALVMAVLLHIRGKVQGVFYRASAKEQADRLGLYGWVRNEADGSVTAHVEGTPEAIQTFVVWCSKGPRLAEVMAVEKKTTDAQGFTSFEIRR